MSRFMIWSNAYLEGFCVVKPPTGIKKAYQLDEGISRADGWPSDVTCRMSPDHPKDIELTDNLYGSGLAVISGRLKAALTEERVNHVEFLPLTILNHKGRVASANYAIMNPLDVCDCIDIGKSGVKWNPIDTESIMSCERLAIKEETVPADWKVFRPKFATVCTLIRTEILERLASTGYKGIHGVDPLQYTGFA
jgi:hypothetical protein